MTARHFGRYEIQSELGRGGMAVVYLAFDPQLGRSVALKVLPAQFLHDPSFLDRFKREAHTIAQLEHHAIVPLYDYGEHDGQPYLVMRYMSGGSLADRLKDGALTLAETLKITERVCAALDKAHLNGIVHRDLKPGNILFDDENAAYLSDFGIVRLSGQTHTHTVIGTPHYMAPEQAHGRPVDSRTDVYQMGVVLFNMLSGRVPFNADTLPALLHMHAYDPVPSIREFTPQLPSSVDVLIRRAMAKEKEARYQSTLAMVAALRDIVAGKKLPEEATTLAGAGMLASGQISDESRSGQGNRALPRWVFYGSLLLLVVVASGALLASILNGNASNTLQVTIDALNTQQLTERAFAAIPTATPSSTSTTTQTATADSSATATATSTPTVQSTSTATPSATPVPRLRVVGASAPIYSGPGLAYSMLSNVLGGETVLVLARTDDGLWYNVELSDGSRAWLAAEDGQPTDANSIDNVEVAATIPPLRAVEPQPVGSSTPTPPAPSTAADRDGDGISDLQDDCPDVYGVPELNGCTIGDGVSSTDTPTSVPPPTVPPLPSILRGKYSPAVRAALQIACEWLSRRTRNGRLESTVMFQTLAN